ncbi:hypothetical protein GX48_08345 [Paracoccidioides brasiliensis]|nr:hypothetical protein GX48_08345 [Paracoccidioides brasiliensis]
MEEAQRQSCSYFSSAFGKEGRMQLLKNYDTETSVQQMRIGRVMHSMDMSPLLSVRWNLHRELNVNRYKYFRWTPRTASISFCYMALVPGILAYIGCKTDVS